MSNERKVRASARVQITLDIIVHDRWGFDCPAGQIHKQAAESALGLLRRGLVVDGMTNSGGGADARPQVRTVGEPKVVAVLVEEDQ